MLRDYLVQLCKELDIDSIPKLNEEKFFPLKLGNDALHLKDLDPGVALHAKICPAPEKKKEEIFIHLMRANLLGQGTGGTRIGMDAQEKFLTLSLGLPYEMNYQTFKETVEDFMNYLIFWRDEVTKLVNEQSVY